MQVEGDFRVRSPAPRVYAFFLDPIAFTDCLDDPHTIRTVDPDHFEGTVTTGISFIRGTFRVRGTYGPRTAPAELHARLQGTGMGSGLDAELAIRLEESEGETTVRWSGEVRLSGPVATLGERIVRGSIDKKTVALFENARKRIEAG